MRLLAHNRDLEPAHPLNASDDPNLLAFGFEYRTLFDVELEECRQRMGAALLGPAIADRLKCLIEGNSRAIFLLARPAWIENACEYAGGDQRWGKATAFLIGPINDFDRRIGLI